MSKKVNQEVLSDFEKQNSLANLCYFNFENTLQENRKKEDEQKYDEYLVGMCDAVYEMVKDKISKEQDQEYQQRKLDFKKDYINKPITKDQANIIYYNKVEKEEVRGKSK